MSGMFVLYVFSVIAVSVLGYLVFLFLYNLLIEREEKVKRSWSEMSVFYKREVDLIPQMLSIINEYARREKEAIDCMIAAQTQAQRLIVEMEGTVHSSAKKVRSVQETDGLLDLGLRKMDTLKKDYPILGYNSQYLTIESKIKESQAGIREARTRYNRIVDQYNHGLNIFPLNIITSLFHFEQKAYFTETN